ncbi:hypothetical protein BpHYR1_046487, partial [Brachionus plicatilis]
MEKNFSFVKLTDSLNLNAKHKMFNTNRLLLIKKIKIKLQMKFSLITQTRTDSCTHFPFISKTNRSLR